MQKGCTLTHQICFLVVILHVQSLLKLKELLSNFIQGWHLRIFDKGKYQKSFLIKVNIFHYEVLYHTKRILSAFMNSVSMYMQSLLIKLPRFTLKKCHLTFRAVVQNYNFLACSLTFSLLSTQKTPLVPVPHSQTMLASTSVHSNAQHAQRLMDVSSPGHGNSVTGERWSNQG